MQIDNIFELLSKDLKTMVKTMSPAQARLLVDAYYQMQGERIAMDGRVRSMQGEPHALLAWFAENSRRLENQVKLTLDHYSRSHPVGQWMRAHKGVGPVISAGLLAHIDINKAPTVGHIWSFAGLAPGIEWRKGEKRPFNASLKMLCAFKLGESFVKVSGRENAYYGYIYKSRKDMETIKNEKGDFADQAAAMLKKKNFRKTTDAYKHYTAGRLPPAHIHARARRYAVKLFLSHLHGFWWEHETGTPPPLPYPIAHLGHVHVLNAPIV